MSASRTFSRRLFLTYQELIEGRGPDLDAIVERFAALYPGVDLEQQLTFRQWYVEMPPRRGMRAVR